MPAVVIPKHMLRTFVRLLQRALWMSGFATATLAAHAQSLPAAVKNSDVQVGAGYSRVAPDYSPLTWNGLLIYGDFDPIKYVGAEAEFHHTSGSTPSISENSFDVGLRFRYPYRNFRPYLKILGASAHSTPGDRRRMAATRCTPAAEAWSTGCPGG